MAKVFWFTGISGAGKSTLSALAADYIRENYGPTEFLDGNDIRDFFENDLGFSREDRDHAIKRSTFGSYLLAKNGINVVIASIAAFYDIRDFVRRKLGDHYQQIYIKASVDTVKARDVRGLYKAHAEGSESNLPGVDQLYEEPRNPNLVVCTDKQSVEDSFEVIKRFIDSKLS